MTTLDLHVRRYDVDVALSLDLGRPQVTALFGPSGAGKTTVLRALAGLDGSGGSVRCGDALWDDGAPRVPAREREVGYVFQDAVLFPHLDVTGNVRHGLQRLPRRLRHDRVHEALALVGAEHLADRRVGGLSGGEAQRVALARALAPRPRLVLLDEPLSALDAPTRATLQYELRRILTAADVPAVLVTHDRTEVLALADEVVLLDAGRVLQSGPPQEVFGRPSSQRAAAAVGVETVELGRVTGRTEDGLLTVAVAGHVLVGTSDTAAPADDVLVCIRAEDVHLTTGGGVSSARNQLRGTVLALRDEGVLTRVDLDCGFVLTALVTRGSAETLELAPGRAVTASAKAQHVHVVPRSSVAP